MLSRTVRVLDGLFGQTARLPRSCQCKLDSLDRSRQPDGQTAQTAKIGGGQKTRALFIVIKLLRAL